MNCVCTCLKDVCPPPADFLIVLCWQFASCNPQMSSPGQPLLHSHLKKSCSPDALAVELPSRPAVLKEHTSSRGVAVSLPGPVQVMPRVLFQERVGVWDKARHALGIEEAIGGWGRCYQLHIHLQNIHILANRELLKKLMAL